MDHDLVMEWMTREDLGTKTVSYAQNHEDILLARALPASEGLFVDVGANHPVYHSVTKLFADRGWTGINIEPSPPVFALLAASRPRDINLNVGAGAADGTLTFFDTPDRHGWATFRPELAAYYQSQGIAVVERPVPVQTLAAICAEHVGDRTIDFLKVDAEGFEHPALLGMDFGRWRPRIVVVENFAPADWEGLLLGADYLPAAFDGLNRYFVRAEEPALLEPLRVPVNILDNFVSYQMMHLIERMEHDQRLWGESVAVLHDLTERFQGQATLDHRSVDAIRDLIAELSERRTRHASFIDTLRFDAPRVAGRLRRLIQNLGGRRRAG